MPDFALGEWLPDQPAVELPGLLTVTNMIPTSTGYESHPQPNVVATKSLLPRNVQGAFSGESEGGVPYILAGTSRDVDTGTGPSLHLGWGSGDWLDVSPSVALSSFGNSGKWEFNQYGNLLIACGDFVSPQVLNVSSTPTGSSAFSELSPNASRAATAAIFKNFLILGDLVGQGTNASAIGTMRNGIHWSAIGNPALFPTVGTDPAINVQSDFQQLDGVGGPVTAIVPGGEYCVIFQERATWRLDYVGAPNVFNLRLIEPSIGCINSRTAIAVNNVVYFASAQGFMAFDGSSVSSTGSQRVDSTWLRDSTSDTTNAVVAHSPERGCVYWSVPGSSAVPGFSKSFAYQYEVNKWFLLTFPTMTWLFEAFSTPTSGSLDTLPLSIMAMDPVGASTLAGSSLDSLGFSDGTSVMGGFEPVYEVVSNALELTGSRLVTFNDSESVSVSGELETGDFRMPDGKRAVLDWIRPVFEPGPNFVGLGVKVAARNIPSTEGSNNYQSLVESPEVGAYVASAGMRPGGRYMRATVSTVGNVRSVSGFNVSIRTGGASR